MSLIRTAIVRPVTVSMFVTAVLLFGVVSLDRLALNLLPSISYPSLTIQTDYPDSAPEEVENLITRPVEEAVGVVPGLKRLTSISRSGQSEVILEFDWNSRMDVAGLEVREKLDFVRLPREAEKPILLRFDPTYDPILRLRLFGDLSLSQLRTVADRELKKYLESVNGVAAIKVLGGLEEQIRVELDEKRLAELGIPITEVTQVLARENLNQAAGSLYDLDANYLVRMLNQFRSVDEIRDIIIRSQEGRRVLLGDVARVWRGTKDRDVIARLNGKETVELAVYKEGDANTVTVARAVNSRLKSLQDAKQFPDGVSYQVVFNQADFIEAAVRDVLYAAAIGGLLATLILFIFLRDLRSTLSISFSIPISVMATFALMYQTDITLNIMSLGGLALGIGMLVDNSIVVLESVDRHRRSGAALAEAVYRGTSEVGRAVTASTLTTLAVFLPLIFVEGIAGQLFRDQALTITYSLLASLLVALTVLPMILATRLKPAEPSQAPAVTAAPAPAGDAHATALSAAVRRWSAVRDKLRRAFYFVFEEALTLILSDVRRIVRALGRSVLKLISPPLTLFQSLFEGVSRVYPSLLRSALDHKAPVVALALLLAAAAVPVASRLGAELIPPLTQGEFAFEIRLPHGTPLRETDRVLRELEGRIAEDAEVATVFSSVGASAENQFARNAQDEGAARLYVVLREREDREAEERVINRIRDRLREFPELSYTLGRPTLFSFKTPVEVEIYAFDLETLRATAERVAARLERVSGLQDIKTTTELGHPEIHVVFDRRRLARMGLDENQISAVLRNKIRGDVATRYREEDRQIDILVRADEADRSTVEDLHNLVINATAVTAPAAGGRGEGGATGAGNGGASASVRGGTPPARVVPIRLGAVADIRLDRGPSEIRRIRSQRAAVVSANVTGRDLGSVSQEIRAHLRELHGEIPPNTNVVLAGQNDELSASYRSLLFALALAVFLVYLVMASQFESLIHPFVILFTVPLGLIGVVFSLWLTGTSLSVMVFLGVIILAGIVVNNAIVLVDYTNQLRRRGLARRQALLEAGSVRLRPIVMTTLTTVLGLAPMALAWGEGSEMRAPMAVTVMGGLLFSTLLTLIFIPVVYEIVDRRGFLEAREALSGDRTGAALGAGWQPAPGE